MPGNIGSKQNNLLHLVTIVNERCHRPYISSNNTNFHFEVARCNMYVRYLIVYFVLARQDSRLQTDDRGQRGRAKFEVVPSVCYFGSAYPQVPVVKFHHKMQCRMEPIHGDHVHSHLPLPNSSRGNVYNSGVSSAIRHASETWAPTVSDLHRLQRNGRAMTRCVWGVIPKGQSQLARPPGDDATWWPVLSCLVLPWLVMYSANSQTGYRAEGGAPPSRGRGVVWPGGLVRHCLE